MQRITLFFVVVCVLAVGFAFGIATSTAIATPTAADLLVALQQSDPTVFPLVDIQQQNVVTVTFAADREDGTTGLFAVPMLLNYNLDVSLTSVFTYEDVPIPPDAIRIDIANIETIAGLQFDITGTPYTAEIPPGVDVIWTPTEDFSGDIMFQGTVTNTDPDKLLKDINVYMAVFDIEGRFLGITSGSNVLGFDETLAYGDSASFSNYVPDVAFLDVAFYKVLVTVDFDSPPPTRGR